MAPEVGLEPTTTRLIPTRRDSTIEQGFSYPLGRLHSLNLPLPQHGGAPSRMLFCPDHSPRSILARELSRHIVDSIVICQTHSQIICVPDVEFVGFIFQYISPKHGGNKLWLQR